MTKNDFITDREWIRSELSDIKQSIERLSDILIGHNGGDGITHRIKYLERKYVALDQKIDNKIKALLYVILGCMVGGSFVWIKESRDVIISFLSLFI